MSDYQQLLLNFERLGLNHMQAHFPAFMDQVNQKETTLTAALLEMTEKEIGFQDQQKTDRVIHRGNVLIHHRQRQLIFECVPNIQLILLIPNRICRILLDRRLQRLCFRNLHLHINVTEILFP